MICHVFLFLGFLFYSDYQSTGYFSSMCEKLVGADILVGLRCELIFKLSTMRCELIYSIVAMRS